MAATRRMPFQPMLARAGTVQELDGDWSVEMKWDGIRVIAEVDGSQVRLWGRRGSDLTERFADVTAELGAALDGRSAVVDGELVVLDAGSRPDFSLIQSRLGSTTGRGASRLPATLLLFDVLSADGRVVISDPYVERRALLDALVRPGARVQVPPAYESDPVTALDTSRSVGLEGIVAKRPLAAYWPGRRTSDWIKVPHLLTCEAVIVGWVPGGDGSLVSLVLAVPTEDEGWRSIGRVSSGIDEETGRALTQALSSIVTDTPAVRDPQSESEVPVVWTAPALVVEAAMTQWTRSGRMRHPRWRGLRLDKTPGDLLP